MKKSLNVVIIIILNMRKSETMSPRYWLNVLTSKIHGTMHSKETKSILLSFVVTHILQLANFVPWHVTL